MNAMCVSTACCNTRVVELTPTYTPQPPPSCTTQDSRALSEKGRRVSLKGVCPSSYGSVGSLETINGPRAPLDQRRLCAHISACHITPPLRDDRCIDRQHSGNLYDTHCTRLQRSKIFMSTTKMRPTSMQQQQAGLCTAQSFMFHARKSQSPIFSETTRERARFCTTVLELGVSWWELSLVP